MAGWQEVDEGKIARWPHEAILPCSRAGFRASKSWLEPTGCKSSSTRCWIANILPLLYWLLVVLHACMLSASSGYGSLQSKGAVLQCAWLARSSQVQWRRGGAPEGSSSICTRGQLLMTVMEKSSKTPLKCCRTQHPPSEWCKGVLQHDRLLPGLRNLI